MVFGRFRGRSGVGLPGLLLDIAFQYLGGTIGPGAFGNAIVACGGVRGNQSGYLRYNARIPSRLGDVLVDEIVSARLGVFGGCAIASDADMCV